MKVKLCLINNKNPSKTHSDPPWCLEVAVRPAEVGAGLRLLQDCRPSWLSLCPPPQRVSHGQGCLQERAELPGGILGF